MTRGNQREVNRERAAKRHADLNKAAPTEPLTVRKARDAEIMAQKQAAAAAKAAGLAPPAAAPAKK